MGRESKDAASETAILPSQYIPDPAEEAWHESPEGLLAGARSRREWAARLIAEAEAMEARANGE